MARSYALWATFVEPADICSRQWPNVGGRAKMSPPCLGSKKSLLCRPGLWEYLEQIVEIWPNNLLNSNVAKPKNKLVLLNKFVLANISNTFILKCY